MSALIRGPRAWKVGRFQQLFGAKVPLRMADDIGINREISSTCAACLPADGSLLTHQYDCCA